MKTVKTKLIIVACVLPLLFMACSKDDDAKKPNTSNNPTFTFLKLGNSWEYELNDNPNYVYKQTIISVKSGIFKIDEDHNIPGVPPGGITYWFANSNHWKLNTDSTGGGGYVVLQRNYSVGQKWDITSTVMKTAEVVSISETVEVPAGIFSNCIKVEILCQEYGFEYYYTYWIRPDIGIIKSLEGSFLQQLKSKNF